MNKKTILNFWPEIGNSKVVHDFYREWPSLHDAEIIEIILNRELCHDFSGPKLIMTLFWEPFWIKSVPAVQKSSKIVLLFEKVVLETLADFNYRNEMADFILTKTYSRRLREHRYKIDIGEFGAKLKFTCGSIKVLSIKPHKPKDYFGNKQKLSNNHVNADAD